MNPASLSRSRYCLLTGAGPAAIAVVRLGGPAMAGFLSRHLRPLPVLGTMPAEGPQRATLLAADGLPLDDVLLLIEGAETERIVELHTHGGPAIVATLTEMLARSGFEQDETPDDLWPLATSLEAEAWALLPRLSTLAGTRWLAAQPQRLEAALREILTMADAEQAAACRALSNAPPAAEWYARAARLALVGPPGAGKSSLMNRLADRPVSIVSPQPGTTRDWVEAEGEIAGFPVCWVDTAGLRDTPDTLEAAGIAATHDVLAGCDGTVVVLDGTDPPAARRFLAEFGRLTPLAVAINKADLPGCVLGEADLPPAWRAVALRVSALHGSGLPELPRRVLTGLGRDRWTPEAAACFTERQRALLRQAADATRARRGELLRQVLAWPGVPDRSGTR